MSSMSAASAAVVAPGQLTVKLMGPQDKARWDAFVDACADATFFHRAGWQRVIEQ
jgi:hypothetical protein